MARRASPDERALWRHATRDVRPRRAAKGEAEAPPPLPPPLPPTTPAAKPAPQAATLPGTGLDRRSAQRLRRGQTAIEARIDLHGMTQAEAHGALVDFVARAQDDGRRAVLVITGKGSREREGVLRRAVPRWLAEPSIRGRVLDIAEAQPRHGGGGALYVLLRRKR